MARACALLWTLTPCARALAHGEPPTALAILSRDAQGPVAVRLSSGLALRLGPQRYQFVCPAVHGDQFPAPAAALADGTLVIGAARGLMLLHGDGSLTAHPDAAALGHSSELVRSAQGVFALRMTDEGSELVVVDAQHVRVLWRDPKILYSLTAFEDKLVVLRGEGLMLEQITISASSGQELERQQAQLTSPIDNVFARSTSREAYALVVLRNYTMMLGTLRMNVFSKLASAELSLAGPLQDEGRTLLATDGELAQLVDAAPQPLPDEHVVHCLDQHDGLAYACDGAGIFQLRSATFSDTLFMMSWLTGPSLERMEAGEVRSRCSAQWQELRADLRLAGTVLREDMIEPADASISAPDAMAPLPDAAVQEPAPTARKADDSCDAVRGRSSSHTAFVQACALLVAFALVRRNRRRRTPYKVKTDRHDF